MKTHSPIAIIGGGPAGLMAADVISRAGYAVDLFDAMPSPGRKFLMAGRGGLNITHAEPFPDFCTRYGHRQPELEPMLSAFGPQEVRAWMHDLGIENFCGSSGRVFPTGMKAAPLLRAWLHRLRAAGTRIHVRHRWKGLERLDHGLVGLHFDTPTGEQSVEAGNVVLALGGGSWSRLGSDGAWVPLIGAHGIPVAPLRPTNCGFDITWSTHLRERFSGHPVKNVTASLTDARGQCHTRSGEFTITDHGIEGNLVYSFSAPLRDTIEQKGQATLCIDLLPDRPAREVQEEVARPRAARSLSSHLQSRLGLKGIKTALLHEVLTREEIANPLSLAAAIKALPLPLSAPRPLDEAISTAGGVCFEALDEQLMLRDLPGVFCAGEMLDWEAPTGGYLLTACLATGCKAGHGVLNRLGREQ